MKFGYVCSLILLAGLFLNAGNIIRPAFEDDPKQMAKVEQIQGKYVFVLSQPVEPFEVVEELNTVVSALADREKDIRDLVEEMVKRGIKKEEKGKIQAFDAIITENGEVGKLIRFKKE